MAWNIAYREVQAADVYGLSFPNSQQVAGAPPVGQMFAFTFTGSNLPAGYPLTIVWRVRYNAAQLGYVTNFFYSTLDTHAFDSSEYYWGAHPYPDPAGELESDHLYSIATEGFDDVTADAGANPTTVPKNVWITHGARVRLVNTDETETDFYLDMAGQDLGHRISRTTVSNWAGTYPPPNAGLVFGDAPWSIAQERLGGILGPVKIFSAFLDNTDILAEADDMTRIVTSAGATNRWWFKPTFDSVDDLTDPVTGKAAAWWNSSYKATRVLVT